MKRIEDYIHLYNGCEIFTGTGYVTLVAVYKEIIPCTSFKIIVLNGNIIHELDGDFKLCLRLLSDMTEEERNVLKNIQQVGLSYNQWDGERVRFLLSKHFDLFGLVEAGLAIPTTKLQNRLKYKL